MKTALTFLVCFLLAVFAGQAIAAAEKGPRCSDGIDNDGDELIDADDPDCRSSTPALPTVVIADADGSVIGVPYDGTVGVWVFLEGYEQPAKAHIGRDLNSDLSIIGTDFVYFSSSNCLGTPYIAPISDFRYVTLHGTRDFGYYLYDQTATVVSTTAASRLRGGGASPCENGSFSGFWSIPTEVQIPHVPPVRYARR